MNSSILIKDCLIPTSDYTAVEEGSILITGSKISNVAIDGDINLDEIEGDIKIIEAKGQLAMPGFIDSHSHLYQTFLRGPLDDLHLTDWLNKLWKYEDVFTDEDVYYSTLLGCLEAIRFGTTMTCDMLATRYPDVVMEAICDSGIRCVVGPGTSDLAENENTPSENVSECLKRTEDFIERWSGMGNGRINCAVAPRGLPSCSSVLMKELKDLARRKSVLFHTHLSEGKTETEKVIARSGKGEAELLYDIGVLDSSTVLAHSIWLSQRELQLIMETCSNPVHCPSTNMKITDGISNVAKMIELGINVSIGCDGVASSSSRDMIREGKLASLLQKINTMDSNVLSAKEVWKMMTTNGAKALGKASELGEIFEGFKADLVLLDVEQVHLINKPYILNNLLYSGTGQDVTTVIIDGKLVLNNREYIMFDKEEVYNRAEKLLQDLSRRVM
jgi:5-methylthioadenosine/S-adenosylhomocysteine deaminase